MRYKIGFIGAGNMAGAIINGIVNAGILVPSQIATFNIHEDKREAFEERGFGACRELKELVTESKYVILSAKPQNFQTILEEIKSFARPEQVFISIAAGISSDFIKKSLGFDARVILIMPNTPLLTGYGTTAISRVEPTSKDEFRFIKDVFASAGTVEEVPCDKMNEVIPLNGSSPAFIYLFAKLFVEAGICAGFDADTANRLFCNTLIGSAHMMLETGKSHQELIDMVTSPKGTTFEGLAALERNGLETAVSECYKATVKRAYEIGK